MKKILLTGGAGFIGSHVLHLLVEEYEVFAIIRKSSDLWRISNLVGKINLVYLEESKLDSIFEKNEFDAVIHLATKYVKFDDSHSIDEMLTSNISFPGKLVELSKKFGVKAFINTGTFFECDCSSLPLDENANIKPFNFYAKTKIAFESLLSTYSEYLNIVTFRLFSPYGERDNEKLIPMIIKKAIRDETVFLSDGLQKLDFIHASDIANAYLLALKFLLKNSCTGYSIYNLGSGFPVSVREVVSIIEQNQKKKIDVVWGKPSTVDLPVVYADIGKIKNDLNWTPKISIHEGLSRTINYYKKEI